MSLLFKAFVCLFKGHDWKLSENARTFCQRCHIEHRDSRFFQRTILFLLDTVEQETLKRHREITDLVLFDDKPEDPMKIH